ncbi:MAG: 1-acyl-sn-glycerol-3-phosphate acyltransferase [Rhodobacteraceae bacterium]|nr:1-acyl-sn-glycerol-3-phosphate acyltransferase [Paracoccaceae bacterium]
MLLLRSMLFDLWLYSSMAVMGVVFAPAAAVSRNAAYWAMRVYCRQALWMLDRLCGLRVERRGKLPVGEVLVAAKHQSFLDILVLMRDLPRPKFVMKRSLVWAPVLGLYALRIGAAPVDRDRGTASLRKMRSRLSDQRSEAGQIVIYPQGTRVAPGAEVRYRRGVFGLYREYGVLCAPVATNAGVFWGRRSVVRRPGVAVVEFLEPIPSGMKADPFMALLEERIETASAKLLKEAG